MALDKHWHLGCFRCRICSKVLSAEYISRWVGPGAGLGRGRVTWGLEDRDYAPDRHDHTSLD